MWKKTWCYRRHFDYRGGFIDIICVSMLEFTQLLYRSVSRCCDSFYWLFLSRRWVIVVFSRSYWCVMRVWFWKCHVCHSDKESVYRLDSHLNCFFCVRIMVRVQSTLHLHHNPLNSSNFIYLLSILPEYSDGSDWMYHRRRFRPLCSTRYWRFWSFCGVAVQVQHLFWSVS